MGKKAYNISLLKKNNINVPDGFVLSFNEVFTKELILEAIDKIGGFPVAVRSSGQIEDLEGASFAGLYETYLNITSFEDFVAAFDKCKLSLKAERVTSYLSDKNLDISSQDLEDSFFIFIQKMIASKISGVLFSTDPISGKEEELYLECCYGLGEKLVSGEINPSQYKINYYTKKVSFSELADEGVDLSASQIDKLIAATLSSCSYFKMPQDIEWAFDDNDVLWILQSRPITNINWRNDYGELTNADLKDGGVSSEVCTPLMFSLYEHCMDISLPQYFRDIKLLKKIEDFKATFHFYGKVYWSSETVKNLLKSMPGFNEEDFDRDLGIFKDYGDQGPIKTPMNLKSLLLGIKTLYYINKEFNGAKKMIRNFPHFFEEKNEYFNDLNNSTANASTYFESLIHEFYIPCETAYFRVIYNNSNYQSLFKDYLNNLSKSINTPIDCVNLMSNLGSIGHMKISKDLSVLREIYLKYGLASHEYLQGRENFLEVHYHHSDRELNLMVERWGERPEKIDELVSLSSFSVENSKNYFVEECSHVHKKLSHCLFSFVKKNTFDSKVNTMRFFLVKREEMRTYSTRCYYQIRKALLKLSEELLGLGLIKRADDLFFMPFYEITDLINSKNVVDDNKIKIRKDFFDMFTLAHTPDDFGHKKLNQSVAIDSAHIKGLGCSKGKVSGIARVILDVVDCDQVIEGEILITKFTDPGWTPVLGRVSGVVTEVGGILSHAAVISREYGIPAVLNCKGVLTKIKTGQEITVDGDLGIITFVSDQAK